MPTAAGFAPAPRDSSSVSEADGELHPLALPSPSSATENSDDEELSYGELGRRCWKLMAASALLHMHGDIDQVHSVFLAVFR